MPLLVPSGHENLSVGPTDTWTTVVDSDDPKGAAWRSVIMQGSVPFDAEITWATGGGAGFSATLSSSRGAVAAIHARHVKVRVRNRSIEPNSVSVSVPDGQASAENVFEVLNTGTGAEQEYTPPPFARTIVVSGNLADQSLITIRLYSPLQTVKTLYTADDFPVGCYLGACSKVTVNAPAGVEYRVAFPLAF